MFGLNGKTNLIEELLFLFSSGILTKKLIHILNHGGIGVKSPLDFKPRYSVFFNLNNYSKNCK